MWYFSQLSGHAPLNHFLPNTAAMPQMVAESVYNLIESKEDHLSGSRRLFPLKDEMKYSHAAMSALASWLFVCSPTSKINKAP